VSGKRRRSRSNALRERIRRSLVRAQAFHRVRAVLDGVMVGAASAALAAVVGLPAPTPIGLVSFLAMCIAGWRAWSLRRTADVIEREFPAFDNLLVTAEEMLRGRHVHPVIANELFAQAAARCDRVQAIRYRPLFTRAMVAGATAAAAALVVMRATHNLPQNPGGGSAAPPGAVATAAVRAFVTPPPYSGRPSTTVDNPVQLSVLEGSRVRVDVNGNSQVNQVATVSQVLLLKVADRERLLNLQVQPDTPPRVTIERPGRDLVFGEPRGSVPISIAAHDDFRVASMTLRYTRISGSGETFTFQEGDVPVEMTVGDGRGAQRARSTIVLDQLKLEDGDTVVYRAFARDDKPGADPAMSESFLIEIGKRAEAAAGGFAVPEDRDRQGLSQQMLIVKTERLHAQRGKLMPDALLEQSRLLAVEQRMVRAEFLFMTGGEVVDEVEEAEEAHELATGRFENQGQVELLNAIREMSRAEARLNAADTTQALVFERAALAALQRAFDRRRYFLRTLPERARIDPTRRLSGDLTSARSSTRSAIKRPAGPRAEAIRQIMVDLASAAGVGATIDARLAARVLTIDPASPLLDKGAEAALAHLGSLLRSELAVPGEARVSRDPLAGALAEQLSRRGGSR
jgi:hypothetical protein